MPWEQVLGYLHMLYMLMHIQWHSQAVSHPGLSMTMVLNELLIKKGRTNKFGSKKGPGF